MAAASALPFPGGGGGGQLCFGSSWAAVHERARAYLLARQRDNGRPKPRTALQADRLSLRQPAGTPLVPAEFLAVVASLGLVGLELRRFLRASRRRAHQCLRLNGLREDGQNVLRRLQSLGWQVSPLPWCAEGFRLLADTPERQQRSDDDEPVSDSLGMTQPYLTGAIYGQEATSMLPVMAARAALGQRSSQGNLCALDLCAAPGSKATQLATWLGSEGLFVANEPNPSRVRVLRKNLLRAGASGCVVTSVDGCSVGALASGCFDLVMVDAPCSSEGTIRKHSDAWQPYLGAGRQEFVETLAARQWELLKSAWEALAPGGVLVYSTCTLNAKENEEQCARLVEEMGAEAFVLPELLGLPQAKVNDAYIRVWPHTFDTDGFFLSCFRKSGEASDKDAPASEVSDTASSLTFFNGAEVSSARSESPPASAGAGFAVAGEEPWRWQSRGSLRVPADAAAAWTLCQEAFGERLSFEDFSRRLCEDAEGQLWLLPDLERRPAVAALCQHMPWPGLRLATHGVGSADLAAPLRLADEALLLSGGRLLPAATEQELAALAARVEGGVGFLNGLLEEAASQGDVARGREVFEEMRRRELTPGVDSYNMLLNAHANSKDTRDVRALKDLMAEMRNRNAEPDLFSYTTLMKAHVRAKSAEGAAEAFDEMRAAGLTPDLFSYNTLLEAHASNGDSDTVQKLLDDMRAAGIQPSLDSFRMLLKAYIAQGDLDGAERTKEVVEEAGLSLDLAWHATLLKACGGKRHDDHAARAQRLFDEMCEAFPDSKLTAYNTLLQIHAGNKASSSRTEAVLEDLRRAELQPDKTTYVTLIRGAAKAGDSEKVEDLFREMEDEGMKPDSLCYSLLFKSLAHRPKDDDIVWAREVIQHMHKEMVQPSVLHFTTLLGATAKLRDFRSAQELWADMRSYDAEPDIVSYNAFMEVHAQSGQLHAAAELLSELRREGLMPNMRTFGTLLKAYSKKGDLAGTKDVLEAMAAQELSPDLMCYNSLLKCQARAGDFASCKSTMADITANGLHPDLASFTAIMTEHAARGDVASTAEVLTELKAAYLEPDRVCLRMLERAETNASTRILGKIRRGVSLAMNCPAKHVRRVARSGQEVGSPANDDHSEASPGPRRCPSRSL
eukprot:TRINITY_DN66074_c0_g1_i3.p1 TRINITY_DN66074_c0_g1~~TRINITY_DN66074_c0_g1_i3.p1  ORF type:complete len:1144 (+),score=263.00 TRINITY_DN66074_c0_g1_i3:48-3434(+)